MADDLVRPGDADSYAVLAVWFLRKSMWWIFWIGLIVAVVVEHGEPIDLKLDTPGDVWERLGSPVAGVIIALGVRLLSSVLALAFAYGVTRDFESRLEARDGFGSALGNWQDRLNIARAFRSLRWTHGVRQVAIRRLGTRGSQLARLDPIMDTANTVLPVIFVIVALVGSP